MLLHRIGVRRVVAATIAIVFAFPFVLAPERTAAAECTGWDSTRTPPPTIRVLRSSGVVQRVDFRRYVEVVMAAEWPSFYPMETLKAAAVAVKQYAWYYTMHGRDWYRTSSGACYDVKDNTNDQIYQPERRTPTANHKSAVSATWGLTVRKNGRFFLTGYRSGEFVSCGADRDGWKLYAHSAFDCGKKGLSREQIQHRYYDPGLTFVWAGEQTDTPPAAQETTPPSVSAPVAGVKVGGTLGSKSSVITWKGSDSGSGLARFQLQKSVAGGTWTNVTLPTATAKSVRLSLALGRSHRFRVRATDKAGNTSAYKYGPVFTPRLIQDTSTAVTYGNGTWSRQGIDSASGDTVRYARSTGATATFTFTGRTVAYVAPRGPNRGSAQVYLDGTLVKTVNLYASSGMARQVLFSTTWGESASHTIRVRVVGTDGRPRVDLDAFLVYR